MDNDILYHKEVESRYHKLHDEITSAYLAIPEFFRKILPSELGRCMQLPDVIEWSDFFEEDDKNKSSIDTSSPEMMGKVVSDNKDDIEKWLLELKELRDILKRLGDFIGVYAGVADNFFEIICENLAEKGQLNLFSEEDPDNSLHLTAEELYAALTLIPIESVRNLLSSLPDSSFSVLYKKYKKSDRNGFIEAYESLGIHGIDNINKYLFPYLEKVYPFYSFSLGNIRRFLPIYVDMMSEIGVSDDVIDTMDSFSDFQDGEFLTNLDIESLIESQNRLFVSGIITKQHDPELPRRFKNKFNKIPTDHLKASSSTNCGEDSSNGLHLSKRTINSIREFSNQWIIETLHRVIEGDIETMEDYELDSKIETQDGIVSSECILESNNNLIFPTRLTSTPAPNRIYTEEQIPVLKEIFKVYGSYFEEMTCEDFLYLFGALKKAPITYNPPYYWTGDESMMKAILRIFYTRQPRLARSLILHISDKQSGFINHDWGKNKNKVSYLHIEDGIADIIQNITRKTLKRL